MKVTVIEIKCYQSKNVFIKLVHVYNNLKKSDTWKIQVTITNNFCSSIDDDEEHLMHAKGDNIEIIINDEENEIIK